MTILKDASATAIYGSRASNGVIIITTKKGTAGKPQINFAANWHVNTARKTYDMMTGDQFRNLVNNDPNYTDATKAQLGDANTNWTDEILRTSFSQDYSLSVGGTAGFLPYRVNASYTNNNGIIKKSDMQRATVGFNLSPKFFNGKLSVNANAQGSWAKAHNVNMAALGNALSYNPTLPVHTNYSMAANSTAGKPIFNGYTNVLANGGPMDNSQDNPVQMIEDERQTNDVLASNGNLQIDYALHFLPELHFNLNLGYEVSQNNWKTEVADNSVMNWRSADLNEMGANGAGTLYKKWELQRSTLLDFYINYRKEFAAIKSNLDVMAGYSWQHFDFMGNSQTYLTTYGYNHNGKNPVLNGAGQYELIPNSSLQFQGAPVVLGEGGTALMGKPRDVWYNELQLVSFFGRLNYSFDDTYLLTFTLRDDGTSRFSKDKRWGLFPSLALGWKIANMPFFESVRDKWNDLKLRLGWGVTGQQAVSGYFPYVPIYTATNNTSYQYPMYGSSWDNREFVDPIYPKPYDENIKWEETTTWNIGIDAAWLNNRITFAADWYLRNTKDLLANTPVAGYATGNYMDTNIGTLRNTGIEVTIGAKPVATKDFTWSTSYNIAYNENKITSLTGDAASSQIVAESVPGAYSLGLQYHMVGEPAFTYRVFQQVYDNDGNPIPGQFVDQDGDGEITDNDLINFHSRDPKVTMTWNNNFNYKNWDLGISLRANLGNYVYNNSKYAYTRMVNVDQYGLHNLLDNTFLFPYKADLNNMNRSSYMVENASFLRCDNITLGYTFNPMLKDRLNLRIFAAVQNPFVITKYKGLDPEVFNGIDNDVYPRPITCTLGLVATF